MFWLYVIDIFLYESWRENYRSLLGHLSSMGKAQSTILSTGKKRKKGSEEGGREGKGGRRKSKLWVL